MDIILSGCSGKMGRTIAALAKNHGINVVAGFDKNANDALPFPVFNSPSDCKILADLVIDFSHPTLLGEVLKYCTDNNIALVEGTTGLSEEHKNQISAAAQRIPLFYSSNMSWGVFVLNKLAVLATKYLGDSFDIEIVESHHRQKVDSPSGTAVTLLNTIQSVSPLNPVYGRDPKSQKRTSDQIGMHSVRGGTIAGKHEILFAGENETISITHNAESREIFAHGALKAALFLHGKKAGLYDMESMVIKK